MRHWTGPELRETTLDRVLLVHDLGNLVKVPELPPDSVTVRDSLVETYETDNDHLLSAAIARELGYSEAELELMNAKVFVNNDAVALSSDYTLKIGAYADQRAAPASVDSLLGRLLEAKDRYRDRPGSSMNRPETNHLIERAVEIERQIFEHVSGLEPVDITEDAIQPFTGDLPNYVI